MHNCNKANKKEAKLKSLDISREAVTKMSLEKLVFSAVSTNPLIFSVMT